MSNNPLKQYFRRPNLYVSLPSKGRFYDDSVVKIPENAELPIFPMSAIDEITIRTPDALINGQAMHDVIKSCIPAIQNPWKINMIDLNAILIAIRIASYSEDMDIESTCPKCENSENYSVNLLGMLSDSVDVDYDTPLKIRDLTIKFKPLTYSDITQIDASKYELQKVLVIIESEEDEEVKKKITIETLTKLNNIMNSTFAHTIEYIKTPETTVYETEFISEFLSNSDRATSHEIKTMSLNLRAKSDIKPIKIKCPHCENQYNQPILINPSDFFA